jgi:hypothetical protein
MIERPRLGATAGESDRYHLNLTFVELSPASPATPLPAQKRHEITRRPRPSC